MIRILYIAETTNNNIAIPAPPFLRKIRSDCKITTAGLPFSGTPSQIRDILFSDLNIGRFDLVVTTSYQLTFAVCLRKFLTGLGGKHVAVGMNLSRRPVTSRYSWPRKILNRVFANLDFVVVHSSHEAALFTELHDLPREKFAFSHWGYDLPDVAGMMFDDYPRPFFCMIGRNNRDHATFLSAMSGLKARGVLIVPGYARLDDLEIPENVDVFTDLPQAECLNCQRNAFANLILVQDGERGAGHITAVSAMHMGVLQIASDVPPLREYLIDGVNALTVPVGDAAALGRTLRTILAEPEISGHLVRHGHLLAERWLTAEASTARLRNIVLDVMEGRRPEFFDPDWPDWRARFGASCEERPPA